MLPQTLPARAFENRRAEVAPAPERLPVEAPTRPVPPKPAATVIVGAFPNNAAIRTPEPTRELEKVAFDAPGLRATEPKPATTTTGGFDRPVVRDTRSDNPRPMDTVVAETGFGRATAAAPPAPESRVVRETAFGNTNSRERPRPTEPQTATVAPSGFSTVREAQTALKPAPPPPPLRIVPVEVLSKPTPPTQTRRER